ncbi:hypothetical protein Tco_1049637, partial [Tanacetum coccineum]
EMEHRVIIDSEDIKQALFRNAGYASFDSHRTTLASEQERSRGKNKKDRKRNSGISFQEYRRQRFRESKKEEAFFEEEHEIRRKEAEAVSFGNKINAQERKKKGEDLLMQVAGCGTAKEIWDSLKSRFIGTEDVQQAHSQQLKSEFERLVMKEDEQ